MSRLSVGSTYRKWTFIVPLLGAILFAGLAVVLFVTGEAEGRVVVLGLAALFVVFTVLSAFFTAAGRRWLTISEGGFTIADASGVREWKDEDVQAMAVLHQKNFSSGILNSITRNAHLWLGGEEIRATNKAVLGAPDEFGDWLDRIGKFVLDRARLEIKEGKTVEGDGWTLSPSELHVRLRGPIVDRAKMEEICAADVFDDNLCIWITGEEEPVFRIPMGSKNSYTLGALLNEHLANRDPQDREPPEGSLGRVLFERKPSPATIRILGMLAGTGLFGGVACFFLLTGEERIWVGLIGVGLGGMFALGSWWSANASFRCHEFGVCKKNPAGENKVRYLDVESFTYGATRQFVNGVYTGTTLSMTFLPFASTGGRRIHYATNLKGMDGELENLREHISRVIAGKMADEVKAGRPAQWTPTLRFLPEGIEHTPSGFFGGKKAEVIHRYEDIQNFDLQEGFFHLWVKGQEKSVVTEPVSQVNFFPGFTLLQVMFAPPDEN